SPDAEPGGEQVEAVSEDELEALDLEPEEEPTAIGTATESDDTDLLTLEDDDLTIDLGQESDEPGVDVSDELQLEPDAIPAEPGGGTDELGDSDEDLTLEDLSEEEAAPAPVVSEPTVPAAGNGGGIVDDDLNIEEELPDDLNDLTLDLDDLDVDAFEESPADALEHPEEVEELDLSALPAGEDTFDEILPDELTQADEGELPELSSEEELTELTLDEGFEGESQPAGTEVEEAGTEDLLNLDDEPEGGLLEEMDTEDDLLDLSMTEDTPTEDSRTDAIVEEAVAAPATSDRSLNLLENIERELATIRSELGDLKRELGELRRLPSPQVPAADQAEGEEVVVGFFEGSEDDDETIALTGSELDNIMHSAEFTEESGQSTEFEGLPPSTDAPILDEPMPEADEPAAPITEIALEEPAEETEPIEIDLDSSDEIVLAGSEDEIEVLAGMDIDAELADIEELEDTTESFTETADDEPAELDLGDATAGLPEEDLVLDAEPLDELDLSGEPDVPAEAALTDEPAIPQSVPETDAVLPDNLKNDLRVVLRYLDQLLEDLPEEKIQEFAQSDHFTVYRRLFEELGLEQ
ncbi:MAG: hypothetical protein V3S41_01270, partial [Spirochaetia bacterium]